MCSFVLVDAVNYHEVHNHECNILFIWLRLFNWVLVFVLFKIETFFDFFFIKYFNERERKRGKNRSKPKKDPQ